MYNALRKGRKNQEKWKRKKAREEAYSNCKWSFFPIYVLENKDKPLMLIFQIMLPSKIISQTNTG